MNKIEKVALRDAFGKAITQLAEEKKDIIALTADLKGSTRLSAFNKKYPERFYQIGVAEQNLIGISAGLAMVGFIPFACSFATFITGRAWELIRVCISANNLPVKIVGSHAGLSHPSDGFTAQATEDLALMQTLPNMTVIYPADARQMEKLLPQIYRYPGPVYLRMTREPTAVFTDENVNTQIGKAQIIKKGQRATVISSGPILKQVLDAAENKRGLEIINLHTIKPFDKDTVFKSLQKTQKLITIEDHQIIGGIASAVAANIDIPHQKLNIGINNKFGKTARSYLQLLREYKLDRDSLKETIKKFLQ